MSGGIRVDKDGRRRAVKKAKPAKYPIEQRPLLRSLAQPPRPGGKPQASKAAKGPLSNTAPEPTRLVAQKPGGDCVDALWATFHGVAPADVVRLIWDKAPRPKRAHGNKGYEQSAFIGSARLFWGGRGDAAGTVHVQLLGQACREWESWHGKPAEALVAEVVQAGGKLTRLDLAHDDLSGVLDLDAMRRLSFSHRSTRQAGDDPAAPARGLRTRFRQVRDFWAESPASGRLTSRGLTFGSGQSLVLCRVYDKGLERGTMEAGEWTRLELQLRDDRAQVLAERLAGGEPLGQVLRNTVAHYLNFVRVNRRDTNASRYKLQPWWAAFLAGCAPRKLGLAEAPASAIKRVAWMLNAWPKALAWLRAAVGPKAVKRFLHRLTLTGWDRLMRDGDAHSQLCTVQQLARLGGITPCRMLLGITGG